MRKLNPELVDLVGPKASAYEIAIAKAVKTAYPRVTAQVYSLIKQAGNAELARRGWSGRRR